MINRPLGMSQLDYLWTNFGNYSISDLVLDSSTEFIPTQSLVVDLLKQAGNKAVGSISLKGNDLVLYSVYGLEISRVNISELVSNNITITDFGLRLVTLADIDNGCPFELLTPIYYIAMSDGLLFLAKRDVLDGFDTSTIRTLIIDNKIVSELKIDSNSGNVLLSTEHGLKATLPIEHLGSDVKFVYLTQQAYNNLINPVLGTIYFIQGKPYFYFGKTKIGTTIDLFEEVDELPVIGEINKIYLLNSEGTYRAYIFINNTWICIGSVGLEDRITNIENILTWEENE